MKPSRSKHIALESIPMSELFKRGEGAIGLYVPTPDSEGKLRESIARISSAAKRWGTEEKKRCVVNTVILLVTHPGDEAPTAEKLVQITVTGVDELTPRGQLYRDSVKSPKKES